MSIVVTAVLALIALYIGNVIGVMVLCDTIPSLRMAKGFAPWVPFIGIMYLFHLLFERKMDNKTQYIIRYLRIQHKNVIFASAVAEAYEEVKEKNNYSGRKRVKLEIFKGGLSELGKILAYRTAML